MATLSNLQHKQHILAKAANFGDMAALLEAMVEDAADVRKAIAGNAPDSIELRKGISGYIQDTLDTMKRIRNNDINKRSPSSVGDDDQ
jgi:hypothetical protein